MACLNSPFHEYWFRYHTRSYIDRKLLVSILLFTNTGLDQPTCLWPIGLATVSILLFTNTGLDAFARVGHYQVIQSQFSFSRILV